MPMRSRSTCRRWRWTGRRGRQPGDGDVLPAESGRIAQAEAYLRKIAETTKSTEAMFDLVDFYIATGARTGQDAARGHGRPSPWRSRRPRIKLALIASIEGRSTDALGWSTRSLAKEPSNAVGAGNEGPGSCATAAATGLRGGVGGREGESHGAWPRSSRSARPPRPAARRPRPRTRSSRCSSSNPNSMEALLELMDLHLQARLTDSAIEYAEQAVRMNPKLVEARLMRVRALAGPHRVRRRAAAELAILQREYPRSPAVQLELGRVAVARRDAARRLSGVSEGAADSTRVRSRRRSNWSSSTCSAKAGPSGAAAGGRGR